jgi:CubicO group peptidase (beta-lactamase class C family)
MLFYNGGNNMIKQILNKSLSLGIIVILLGVALTSSIGFLQSNYLMKKSEIHKLYNAPYIEKIETIDYQIGSFSSLPSYKNMGGISKDKNFDRIINALMTFADIPSLSTAIVVDDDLVFTNGYGLYDIENNKETNGEIIYLVASISKMFTATAIMQLYEKGYFDLDDDVNNYLNFNLRNPNYPDKNITFRMLLAHQSSLATDLPTFFTILMPGELTITGYPDPFLEDLLVPGGIHYRPQVWNSYPPGEDMYYANIGYGVLGYLVEIISGQTFEECCRENIFEPLEMHNTSFQLTNLNISNIAVPYEFINREYYPYIHYNILDYPAGGLRTSVSDLSHYLITNMNNGTYGNSSILSPKSVEEMHVVQYQSDTYNFQYGLGFQIWETSKDINIGHTGGLFGVATKMKFRKSNDIGIIMFTNKEVGNLRDRIVFSLIELLLFKKASEYSSSELHCEGFSEIIRSNEYLTKDFDIYRKTGRFN